MPENNSEEPSCSIRRCRPLFHFINFINNHMGLSNALQMFALERNSFVFDDINQLHE